MPHSRACEAISTVPESEKAQALDVGVTMSRHAADPTCGQRLLAPCPACAIFPTGAEPSRARDAQGWPKRL